jgi:hypothetical protein
MLPLDQDNLYYKLTAVDNQGNESMPSEELHVSLTGVTDNRQFTIDNYKLYQNYPNPFNPTTKIKYQLPEISKVKLIVYDVLGREIRTLVNEEKPAGTYEVEFDGKGLPSSVYIYRIETGKFSDTKKIVLLK